MLTVLVPLGGRTHSSGTAQAVLDYAQPGARLIFSCGWHITRDGKDVYPPSLQREMKMVALLSPLLRHVVDIDDQVEACRRVFASDTRWTVVRGSDLEEGESQGLPVWSKHVGDPILESNMTRRVDYALFMVAALEDDHARSRGAGDRGLPDRSRGQSGRLVLGRQVTVMSNERRSKT